MTAVRREVLLTAMQRLADRGINCRSCAGTCCTFVANSMQLTPAEAGDIVDALRARGELTADLRARLLDSVTRYGLDRPIPGNGGRELMRRRYTCTFFSGGAVGCQLPPEAKPLGCLAYNPTRLGVKDGEGCASDQRLLGDAALHGEMSGYDWEKLPIPRAVLAVWEKTELELTSTAL